MSNNYFTIEKFYETLDNASLSHQFSAGVIIAHRAHQYHHFQDQVILSTACYHKLIN